MDSNTTTFTSIAYAAGFFFEVLQEIDNIYVLQLFNTITDASTPIAYAQIELNDDVVMNPVILQNVPVSTVIPIPSMDTSEITIPTDIEVSLYLPQSTVPFTSINLQPANTTVLQNGQFVLSLSFPTSVGYNDVIPYDTCFSMNLQASASFCGWCRTGFSRIVINSSISPYMANYIAPDSITGVALRPNSYIVIQSTTTGLYTIS
ncbi:MAG: hypothetical protein EBV19_09455 [Flavobacteriia bacterium]|nr:hypothetical protein [Flavobacteriia bacterium]